MARFFWKVHASRITGYSYVDFFRKARNVSVACIGSTEETIDRSETLTDRYGIKASGHFRRLQVNFRH